MSPHRAVKHTCRMLLLLLAICVGGVLLKLWFSTRDQVLVDEVDVFAAMSTRPALFRDPATGQLDPMIHLREGIVLADGRHLVASSVSARWPGEGPLSALLDGDLHTRWASAPTEPQRLTLDLAQEVPVGQVRLHWEHATAGVLITSVSHDGRHWQVICKRTDGRPGPCVEVVEVNRKTRYLRLDLRERQNPAWGFSLYELQVIPVGATEPLPLSPVRLAAVVPSS